MCKRVYVILFFTGFGDQQTFDLRTFRLSQELSRPSTDSVNDALVAHRLC